MLGIPALDRCNRRRWNNCLPMSLKVGDEEPLSKKRKHEAEPSSPPINVAASDFPLMEDEATARSKLEEAGFDPDASLNESALVNGSRGGLALITPMIYFCRRGDVPMCQYLLSKGATTTRMGKE